MNFRFHAFPLFGGGLIAGLVLAGTAAFAADPTGSWVVSEEDLRPQIEELVASEIEQVPADQQEQARQMMEAMEASIVERMAGTLEFDSDNSFTFTSESGVVDEGRWSMQGEEVLLEPLEGNEENEDPMLGVIEGDRLSLKPASGDEMPFTYVFQRQ